MRRIVALLLPLALWACGQPTEQRHGSPALWQVDGPAGERGWLFGTIHALPEDVMWRTATLDMALGQADALVLEISDVGDARTAQAAFQVLAMTPGQPPLSQRVPAEDRAMLAAALARADLRNDGFAQIETWAAALMLAQALSHLGDAPGVDEELLRSTAGKPVRELEGRIPQLKIFDQLPEKEQSDLLVSVAREGLLPEKEEQRLFDAWLAGDVSDLENELDRGLLADPELKRALLLDRNHDWLRQLAAMIRSGQHPFVAVGAAHVVGPEGLAALLAQEGFTVTRLQ